MELEDLCNSCKYSNCTDDQGRKLHSHLSLTCTLPVELQEYLLFPPLYVPRQLADHDAVSGHAGPTTTVVNAPLSRLEKSFSCAAPAEDVRNAATAPV